MPIDPLFNRTSLESSSKEAKMFDKIQALLEELRLRELPEKTVKKINQQIGEINTANDDELRRQLSRSKRQLLRILEKDVKLVPKNYYRTLWIGVGMGAFGVPFGTVFGTLFDNMGFIGIGLPIGMAIGIAIGSKMDDDAAKEGRQLNISL